MGNLKGKRILGDLKVDGRRILTILKNWDVVV
jgi:hypothetical protein